MSWDDWCSHIKAAGFVAGGIYGQDGSTWSEFCEDSNLKFAGEEISHINKCIQTGNPSAEKVCVNGAKQTVLKADTSDGILLGKNKTDSCLVSVKCNTCVVVGVGGKGSEPRSLLDPLTKLGNSLKEHGY